MGAFDLPTGNFELYLIPVAADCSFKKEGWESVAITDYVTPEEVAQMVEEWTGRYEVRGARYNGRPVTIPTGYHWEIRCKGETIAKFRTRKEAIDDNSRRKWARKDDPKIRYGGVYFVKD